MSVPDDIQTMPATNRPGDRWALLKKTSPSGKAMFRCLCCGHESVAPQKVCWELDPSGSGANERRVRIDCITWQRVNLWRYHLPSERDIEGWATIVLGSDGYFSAVSDYGNYAFRWTAHGEKDFRKFLVNAHQSWDYFASKFGQQVYDGERSLLSVKTRILESRRALEFTQEFARREWDLLKTHEDLYSEMNFGDWLSSTELGDAWEHHCTSYPANLRIFCQKTLKRLSGILEAELKKEGVW